MKNLDDLWWVIETGVQSTRCTAGDGQEGDPDEPASYAIGRPRYGFSTRPHIPNSAQGDVVLQVTHIRRPFDSEPDFRAISVTDNLKGLLAREEVPC
jgi:hypothetical protein